VAEAEQHETPASRSQLVIQFRRLEEEIQQVEQRLLSFGGETLPGVHLVIEAAGCRALLSSNRVVEVVRLVATTPVPGAARHVHGTFLWRRTPVIAVDLRKLLGAADEPGLEAQMVILTGSPCLALVVDHVPRLLEDPKLFEGEVAAGLAAGLRDCRLVVGLCLDGEEVLPVIDPTPIQAELAGRTG